MARSTPDEELRRALADGIRGEVRVDTMQRGLYATDASVYQEMPIAVVVPRDVADVAHAHRIACERRLPILPRGGGTALGGQTTGAAIVLDFSKYCRRIGSPDLGARRVEVEPGRVRDELNAALAATGLHFAPETATSNRATLGGMIGNNSSGTRSIKYGKTIDHIEGLRVMLATGETLDLRSMSRDEWDGIAERDDREGRLYRRVREVIEANRDEIGARYPKVMRRVAGYNLDAFPEQGPWNLAHLVVGCEGTLATVLDATVRLEPNPKATAVLVVHFDDLHAGLRSVPRLLEFEPSAVELLDQALLRLTRENPKIRRTCDFVEGDPAVVLIVELMGESSAEVTEAVHGMAATLERERIGSARVVRTDAAGIGRVWEVRKAGVGILMGMRGERKPLPFIEDAAVPVESLADYIAGVERICAELDVPVTMYAHASVGLLHVRPVLDLRDPSDVAHFRTIAWKAFELVREYGGSWSGEHGDGRVRSPMIEPFFGPQLTEAFRQVKRAFDPDGIMNPGKILDPEPIDASLRGGPDVHVTHPKTRFAYRDEGTFAAAVDRCTGVGACRKTLGGTMCPSYIATRDEEHSTRGRANALRLAMTGRLAPDTYPFERLREVFDLCLSCKACATECPSGVDMARLKSELLAQDYDANGVPRAARFYADSARWARRLAGPLAPLVNFVAERGFVRAWMEARYGLDRRRPLPPIARRSFRAELATRSHRAAVGRRRVMLFVDTYSGYHDTEVGRAAVSLLERLGYDVEAVDVGCCQRPNLSLGLLDDAAREGAATVAALDDADSDRHGDSRLVVLEPSCASALSHDLPDLVRDTAAADRVASRVRSLEAFLEEELVAGRLETSAFERAGSVSNDFLVHGHCHQKALEGTASLGSLLARLPGADVTMLDAGCCGMAGAFGYEKRHYDLSMRIGEDRLFPSLREARPSDIIVANGFSCRHQIADALGRRAVHPAVALEAALSARAGS